MKIEIRGIVYISMLDWEGKIVTTLFTPRCNFRCPFCHNAELVLHPKKHRKIPLFDILYHLDKYKKWIDGICLTGGEPCMYEDIDDFLVEIRKCKPKVKLDTNGSFPKTVARLIKKKLIDYVAMDIKTRLDDCGTSANYETASGLKKIEKSDIKKSIKLIMGSGINYEFRTTVVPGIHTTEDILAIANHIKGAKKYYLQNFAASEALDPAYRKIQPYEKNDLEEMRDLAGKLVKECMVRS